MSVWQWSVDEGLIKGDASYYANKEAKSEEFAHAVSEAYTNANDAQRKQLVDKLYAEYPDQFKGSPAYWYTYRATEVGDFAAAAGAINPISGGTTPGGVGAPPAGGARTGARMSLPGSPEVWKVGSEDWLIYNVPDAKPPIYLAWKSPSPEDTQSFFGPGQQIRYDRTLNAAGFKATGAVDFGTTDELANFDDDPFTSWSKTMATEAQSQPWILDRDYQQLVAMATLEGRSLTTAEVQSTGWWRSNSESQREWMKLYHGDPTEASRRIADNRALARQSLNDAGIQGFTDEMVSYMADQVTQGQWSEIYFNQQVNAVSDPSSIHDVDNGLTRFQTGLSTTIAEEDTVKNLSREWLGPAYGVLRDEEVGRWAGVLRNDPNGEQRFVDHLQNTRLSLFPEYEDKSLSYEDVASPWRNYATNVWGQAPDETDDFFQQLVKNNDAVVNGQALRREGLKRNNKKVAQDASSAATQGFGGSIVRALT